MAGLQEKAIENLLCLIPTKVFMRKNEKSISSSILRSIILIILSISTDIYFRNGKKFILKLIQIL